MVTGLLLLVLHLRATGAVVGSSEIGNLLFLNGSKKKTKEKNLGILQDAGPDTQLLSAKRDPPHVTKIVISSME